MEKDTKTKIELDMPCRCNADGVADADERRERVSAALEIEDQSEFVTNVIADLRWSYDCDIDGVYMDMWFGIRAENETEHLWVQCDRVEDGLATLWEYHNSKSS